MRKKEDILAVKKILLTEEMLENLDTQQAIDEYLSSFQLDIDKKNEEIEKEKTKREKIHKEIEDFIKKNAK